MKDSSQSRPVMGVIFRRYLKIHLNIFFLYSTRARSTSTKYITRNNRSYTEYMGSSSLTAHMVYRRTSLVQATVKYGNRRSNFVAMRLFVSVAEHAVLLL